MGDRVHLRRRGRTYWVDYTTDGGKRVRRSLGTRIKASAEQERARLEYKLRSGELEEAERLGMVKFLAEYEAYQLARKTKKSFQNDWSYLKGFLGEHPLEFLDELTVHKVSHYLTERRNRDKLSPRSLNRIREVLHTMGSYAVSRGYLEENPVSKVKPFAQPQGEIRFLTLEEIDGLLVALRGDLLEKIVATLIFSGLRHGEACWLTWDDVDLKNDLIHVRAKTIDCVFWEPKTKRPRRVPINSRLRPYLKGPHNGCRWVFPSPQGVRWDEDNLTHRFRRTMKRLELTWRIADLRHTFGSQLAQKGVSLFKIATLMGNSPGIVQKHYARLIPEELREEVEF